jgi:hypothetical protein
MRVERITIEDLAARGLLPRIREILVPSYETTPDALLERAVAHCTDAYLGHADGALAAFFMVAWETLVVDGREHPAVYLGLSAEGADHGATDVSILYRAFIEDACGWEREQDQRLLLWGTTATPSAFWAVERLFTDGQPLRSGEVAPWAEPVFAAIRAQHYATLPHGPADPPFVLRRAARSTRYAAAERERIARIETRRGFRLFRDIGLEEPRGDRIAFVCRTRQPGE